MSQLFKNAVNYLSGGETDSFVGNNVDIETQRLNIKAVIGDGKFDLGIQYCLEGASTNCTLSSMQSLRSPVIYFYQLLFVKQFSRLSVIKNAHSGGFGKVYRVTSLKDGSDFALKVW